MAIVYVDGCFLPRDRAMIPVDDLAVVRGYAALDILRTFDGQPYFIDDHIRRLMGSCHQIGLELPWPHGKIKSIILEVLEKNQDLGDVNIRTIITAGSSPDFFTPSGRPRLIVMADAVPILPEAWYTKGIKVISVFEERPIPDAKLTAYIPAAMALKKARAVGAVEAIYVSSDNLALEATTSNLFAVMDNRLVTPDKGVLKGITRKAVLALAEEIMETRQAPLALAALLQAEEVFITGTNKGVVPVVQIDDTLIANGVPGPYTLELMKALKQHASEFRKND